MLDRLDLDTDQPTEEELAKRFGYEEDFHAGASNILWNYWSSLHESTLVCMCLVEFGLVWLSVALQALSQAGCD